MRIRHSRRAATLAILSLVVSGLAAITAQTPAHAAVTVSTFAGTGTAGFSGDGGPAVSAQLRQPMGVAANEIGNVYIYDDQNRRIRKVSPDGSISTHSGDGSSCSTTGLTNSFGPDNSGICSFGAKLIRGAGGTLYIPNSGSFEMVTPSGAKYHVAGTLNRPCTQDADGNAYATCVSTSSGTIIGSTMYYPSGAMLKAWNMSLTSGTISTVAGNGNPNCNSPANDGDLAMGACIHPSYPTASGDSIYFFDSMSTSGPRILRISLNESPLRIHKVAGTGSWSDYGLNGPAVNAGIGGAGPIAISSTGEIYFGRGGEVRKVDSSGYLRYVAYLGAYSDPTSMAFDRADNLYVASPLLHKIQKVSGLATAGFGAGENLVAIGDSVTAGEGINYHWVWNGAKWVRTGPANPTWTNTTTSLGANWQGCHQSDYAYSQLAYADGFNVHNMACSGATADELLKGKTVNGSTMTELGGTCAGCQPPNADYDAHQPDRLLITVGANDVTFGDWVAQCYGLLARDCGNQDDENAINNQLIDQKAALRALLREIKRRGEALTPAHVPDVYLGQYYNPFPLTYPSSTCKDISPTVGSGVNATEMAWMGGKLGELNTNIQDVANEAEFSSMSIHVVNLGDVMNSHRWCDPDPWVYGVSLRIDFTVLPPDNGNPAPFHPTPAGQWAIYNKFKACMNGGSCN